VVARDPRRKIISSPAKPFAWSLTFFFASAVVGALISYNPAAAWPRFALIVTGLVFSTIFAVLPMVLKIWSLEGISLLRLTFAILPAAVIVYFVLTNDWTARLGKLSWLDPVLRSLATWHPQLQSYRMDSNSLGGVVAELLPLQLSALLATSRRLTWAGFVLIALSAAGLLLSESRGAWIALAAVAGLALLWKLSGLFARRWTRNRQRETKIAISAAILLLLALVGAVSGLTPFGQTLLQSRNDRLTVWRNSLDLASDYPFTGLGLGGFDMAYSSYVLLLHVSHTTQANNLYIDLWLEQGWLGLVALGGLIVFPAGAAIRFFLRGEQLSYWQVAAFASLGVVLLHGIVDDPFYGYGGTVIPFFFIPLGLVARRDNLEQTQPRGKSHVRMAALLGVVAGVSLLIIVMLPKVRSAFVSNMATLSQTRAELSVYNWPAWGIQDELRRSDKIDLGPAIALYETSLEIDPLNATSNRRLGQIELSRGLYAMAQEHLEAAYAAAPSQRATRQILGELYAIGGNLDKAVVLWKSIDVSDGQLETREWWYEHIGEHEYAARIMLAAE
jgi:putative inorganic carbon (hco3(-)) transporter